MKVAFRVDSSFNIGTGHVMRCLSLAAELRRRNCDVTFISRLHPGHINSFIESQGHKVLALPFTSPQGERSSLYGPDWLGTSQEQDLAETTSLIQGMSFEWLIVDHYSLDRSWERGMRSFCKRILVIDDLADRSHDCDILFDQTFGRQVADYQPLVNPESHFLVGSVYALLRPEFAELRAKSLSRRHNNTLSQVLISMGGVDKINATRDVLMGFEKLNRPEIKKIIVILGKSATWLSDIQEFKKSSKLPIELVIDTNKMGEIMINCDLAIGATGGSTWERCTLGLPTLSYVIAENQELIAQKLEEAGATTIVGRYDSKLDYPLFKQLIESYIQDPSLLTELSKKSETVSAGNGVGLVCDEMLKGRFA